MQNIDKIAVIAFRVGNIVEAIMNKAVADKSLDKFASGCVLTSEARPHDRMLFQILRQIERNA